MSIFRKELGWVIVIMFGSITAGYPLPFMSSAGPQFQEQFHWSLTTVTWFSTMVPLVSIVGAQSTNLFVPRLGRKKSTFLYGIFALVPWVLTAITQPSYSALAFVARVLLGISTGALNSLCSMYIVELAPEESKGSYGTLHQLGITIGMAIDYLLGIWCTWRVMAILNCITEVIMCVSIWFIPESPAQNNTSNETFEKESLFQKKFIPPMIMSFVMIFLQQFAGINAMSASLQNIFDSANVSINSSVAALLVGLSQIISTLLLATLISKFGRKLLFIISEFGQALALLLFWASYLWDIGTVTPIIALFLDFFFFGCGCGPIPFFIVPELFPDSVRQLAVSIITAVNFLLASITIIIWPEMSSAMGEGWGTFVFCIVCILGGIYGIFKLPDSKSPSGETEQDVLDNDNVLSDSSDSPK